MSRELLSLTSKEDKLVLFEAVSEGTFRSEANVIIRVSCEGWSDLCIPELWLADINDWRAGGQSFTLHTSKPNRHACLSSEEVSRLETWLFDLFRPATEMKMERSRPSLLTHERR